MSLFDVIKYPIGGYPTKEVLDNLPDQLFNEWVILSDFEVVGGSSMYIRKNVAEWYSKYYGSPYFTKRDYNDIQLLRKMIVEYEPI